MILQEYKNVDNIKIFHETIDGHADYNVKGLENLYKQEEKHFWFIARKEFIFNNIKKFIEKHEKIIEIGAGTGNVSRYLIENEYKDISVGEMHLTGLKYAQSYGIEKCYQFNLLDTPFENEFNAVCMFDVLEHIEDASAALKNVNRMLQENGKIVLTVPSHMWLWNRSDAIAGHKIRYTKKQLMQKLEEEGFEVLSARYFFISIILLLILRRLLEKDNGREVKNQEYDKDISIISPLNHLLLWISRIENKLNRFLPNLCGGSLFIVGRKR
ncbi:class I SAM-dependent methyltransferase [Sulfurimonas sp. HSL-1716]|uniref:class I SAM-dependent methyltransferase n=1 Tax=Hydrocurvibacter sulfurireducens TaxID=3131937 RepID=UPI0031F80FB1